MEGDLFGILCEDDMLHESLTPAFKLYTNCIDTKVPKMGKVAITIDDIKRDMAPANINGIYNNENHVIAFSGWIENLDELTSDKNSTKSKE